MHPMETGVCVPQPGGQVQARNAKNPLFFNRFATKRGIGVGWRDKRVAGECGFGGSSGEELSNEPFVA